MVEIVDYDTYWEVHTIVRGIPTIYTCRRLILATTITNIERLFPHPYTKLIHPSPTMRIYGEFRKQDIPLLQRVIKGHTMVPFPLHQIIPIDANNGVYMIAYVDEEYSKELIPLQEDTDINRSTLCRMIESAFQLPKHSIELVSIHSKYWEEAVHYIDRHVDIKVREEFLKSLQHPHPMLRIVGEAVTEDNGWVEAALKTVHEIDWVKNNEEDNKEENEDDEEDKKKCKRKKKRKSKKNKNKNK